MPKPLPSPEMLRKLLRCDPDAGKLYWRQRTPDMFTSGKSTAERVCTRWNTRYAGKEALTAKNGEGYLHGKIFKRSISAHRVIWAITHGGWPLNQVDHISGDTADNRIANLRTVTNQENGLNQKLARNNTSGVCGVFWDKSFDRWVAKIKVAGKQMHIGCFIDKSDAIVARKSAEVKYGFHPNHGRA